MTCPCPHPPSLPLQLPPASLSPEGSLLPAFRVQHSPAPWVATVPGNTHSLPGRFLTSLMWRGPELEDKALSEDVGIWVPSQPGWAPVTRGPNVLPPFCGPQILQEQQQKSLDNLGAACTLPSHPGCPQRPPHKPMPPLQPSLVLRAEFGVHGHTQLKEGLGGQVWRPLARVVSRVPARLTLQGRVTWVCLQSGHTWPQLGHAGAGPPSRASSVTPCQRQTGPKPARKPQPTPQWTLCTPTQPCTPRPSFCFVHKH